ncbi:unnamed protein product [Lampetra fluviatilis]
MSIGVHAYCREKAPLHHRDGAQTEGRVDRERLEIRERQREIEDMDEHEELEGGFGRTRRPQGRWLRDETALKQTSVARSFPRTPVRRMISGGASERADRRKTGEIALAVRGSDLHSAQSL